MTHDNRLRQVTSEAYPPPERTPNKGQPHNLRAALTALVKHLCAEGQGDSERWKRNEMELAKLVSAMTDQQLHSVRNIGHASVRELRAWHRALGIGLPPSEHERRLREAIAYVEEHGYRVIGPVRRAS